MERCNTAGNCGAGAGDGVEFLRVFVVGDWANFVPVLAGVLIHELSPALQTPPRFDPRGARTKRPEASVEEATTLRLTLRTHNESPGEPDRILQPTLLSQFDQPIALNVS